MNSSIQERINAVQDELDRFFPARGGSLKDAAEMGGFDFMDSLIQLLNPQLVATEQTLKVLVEGIKADEKPSENLFSMDVESIAQTIFEAKKCAYLIGVIVGLRMMEASRQSINDLLFDSNKFLIPGNIQKNETRGSKSGLITR